jgi:hypothetical protein
MNRSLFQRTIERQGKDDGTENPILQDIKWRRKGTDRRGARDKSVTTDDVERRTCVDRRHDYMTLISNIIFPRGVGKELEGLSS